MGLFGKKKPIATENLIQGQGEIQNSVSAKDIIAPSALKVHSKHLEISTKLSRTLFIVSYPRFLNEGWLSPIINLDKEFDISIFVHPIETRVATRKLRKKVVQVESQIIEREQQGIVRDPKLDRAHSDLENLREKLEEATEKLFDVGVYITVYGETQEELDKTERAMRSLLESRLIFIKPAIFQQEQGFRSTTPLGKDLLEVHTKLNSSPLSSMFPFVSFNLSSEKGILFGINKHNASLIVFDRFSLPNYNSVTFATSGAGKSYAIKLEVIRSLMVGTDVIVIDPENEFQKLASATGGRHFNFSLNSDHHINPFDLPGIGEDEKPEEIFREHVASLIGLFHVLFGDLSEEEDSILDRAIIETYALKDIVPTRDFTGQDPPLLSDLELVIQGLEGAENLAIRLEKYTKGIWSNFLNKPTNVDMDKNFIVFSIRDMQEELKSAAMHMITNFIWTRVRKTLKKRLLVVDEAWIMMRSESSASFLFGMVKRGRKYFLGVAVITQDVGDFLRSEFGTPIITNSALVLLLKQSPTTLDNVQKVFNLTEEEKFLLLESPVGEGIFIAGIKRVAISIIASYVEDKLITSDPSQLLQEIKN